MKEKIRLGVIGLGCRGISLLEAVMLPHADVELAAVCDLYEDRREKAAQMVREAKGTEPLVTGNYKDVIAMEDLDAVAITAWPFG